MLRLATRGSPLARWQAEWVAERVEGPTELVIVETTGDLKAEVALADLQGVGVFVKEVQAAVLEGHADAAVHSAKDLTSVTAPGLVLAAVGEREDPRDALVGSTLDALPPGATVATGAVRRRALLHAVRPDLVFAELRGNIATRLRKAEGFDAIVVAVAALKRLGLEDRIAEALDPDVFVPQAAQGAIAVECRADDDATGALLTTVDHAATRWAITAERACLATFGGGCTLPVGAYATDDHRLRAVIVDNGEVRRAADQGDDPLELGRRVAERIR